MRKIQAVLEGRRDIWRHCERVGCKEDCDQGGGKLHVDECVDRSRVGSVRNREGDILCAVFVPLSLLAYWMEWYVWQKVYYMLQRCDGSRSGCVDSESGVGILSDG